MSPVERVARAICQNNCTCPTADVCVDWMIWKEEARAAIEAMEPDENMILHGAKAMDGFQAGNGNIIITGQPKDIFNAMRDAALGEER